MGDRSNMAFQNTSVTRGTATVVVTATGMQTQMGQIATMLTSVTRTRSPLQKELDSLTKVLAIIAWSAVAFIFVVGLARGEPAKQLLLLGTAMAIAAIPTGLPAFVSGLLSMGAKQLAESKAVVKNLTDVETLGATSAINTDKTGTLTMNEMMVSDLYVGGLWFTVEGEGYAKTGAIRAVAGAPVPDFTRLALGLCLDSDATVDAEGNVVGDPTEAALVVLAAKLGVDADETRPGLPAPGRGALRLGVQVHGHLPRGHVGRRPAARRAGEGRARRRAGAVQPVGWSFQRLGGPDRGGQGRHRCGQRAHGGAGPARPRLRGARRERRRALDHGVGPDDPDHRPGLRRHGRASSTRCGPRPRGRCTRRSRPGSTCA